MVPKFVLIFGPLALKEKGWSPASHIPETGYQKPLFTQLSWKEEEAFYLNKRRLSNNQPSNTETQCPPQSKPSQAQLKLIISTKPPPDFSSVCCQLKQDRRIFQICTQQVSVVPKRSEVGCFCKALGNGKCLHIHHSYRLGG